MREELDFFRAHGYLVLPGALSAGEVQALNRALDEDREKYPQLWPHRGEGGRFQSVSVLLTCPLFDRTLLHPAVLPLVEGLMGSEVCFEEVSAMVREKVEGEPPPSSWHRDTGHLPAHPFALRTLSLVYYLSDVDEATHCFGVVPEDVESKRREPKDRDGSRGVPLHGGAGTAILFNAGSCHAGIVRQSQRQRRTVHIYYGHRNLPPLSEHTLVPRRLVEAEDEGVRRFFCRPNLSTRLALENF